MSTITVSSSIPDPVVVTADVANVGSIGYLGNTGGADDGKIVMKAPSDRLFLLENPAAGYAVSPGTSITIGLIDPSEVITVSIANEPADLTV